MTTPKTAGQSGTRSSRARADNPTGRPPIPNEATGPRAFEAVPGVSSGGISPADGEGNERGDATDSPSPSDRHPTSAGSRVGIPGGTPPGPAHTPAEALNPGPARVGEDPRAGVRQPVALNTLRRPGPPLVLGIDPGGRSTGFVVRCGSALIEHEVVSRQGGGALPTGQYLSDVISAAHHLLSKHPGIMLVAVEGLVPPSAYINGRKRMLRPIDVMGAAAAWGAVTAEFPGAAQIAPAGHGQAGVRAYPAQLVGPREGPALTGILRHCRAAWDIAGVAGSPIYYAGRLDNSRDTVGR